MLVKISVVFIYIIAPSAWYSNKTVVYSSIIIYCAWEQLQFNKAIKLSNFMDQRNSVHLAWLPPLVKSTESGSQSLVPFFFVFYARTINHLHKIEHAGYGKLPNPMLAILAFSRPFFSLFLCRVGNSSQAQITLKSSRGRGSKEQCKRCLMSTQRTVLEMMSTRLAC